MLQLKVPALEYFDESTQTFVSSKEQTLKLEHSLISLSAWEAKWNKPFLNSKQRTMDETIDYIRCMTINSPVDDDVYLALRNMPSLITKIFEYINAPMTATTINNRGRGHPNREIITSELIYYWMASYGIWKECEEWHLNRLLMLIQVCNVKEEAPQKMGKMDQLQNQRALNAARRAKSHSRG